VDRVGHEFVDEYVVVGCVADRATNHTNCERERADGGYEVVGTDDCGDDGGGDNDASNAEATEDEQSPGAVKRIYFQRGESADSC